MDLREQLITSQSTTPHRAEALSDKETESTSDSSLLMSGLDPDASLPSMTRLVMPTPPNMLDSDSSGYSLVHSQTELLGAGTAGMELGHARLDQELATAVLEQVATNPELRFRLNVIQEDQEEDIKYYPG